MNGKQKLGTTPEKTLFLCDFSEMEDLSTRGFDVKIKRKTTPIFIIRKGDKVYGYQNICPHTQAPLEWNPNEFLNQSKQNIICAMHGAEFSIEAGACLGGPCNGEGLTSVKVGVVGKQVVLYLA